jgi:N-methylhydantoinase B
VTGPEIPTNGGCFRTITLNLPEGSIVNPREPAPVNSRTATIKRVSGAILGAFAEALPERIPADSAGELIVTAMGGTRADGSRYVTGELIAGGSGASVAKDGVDAIETDATNCMNLPAESLEMDAPVRVHRIALREDSGGAGRQRGGLGTVREYEILEGKVRFTHRGERHFCAPRGRAGGHDGAMARTVIKRASGELEVVASKIVTTLGAGDRVIMETAGGAGYGDPQERDSQRLEQDVIDGKVSAAAAKLYGVPAKV